MLQRGQRGVVWFEASTLYKYDVRKGDLFVLSCARMRRCDIVSVASVVFIVGAAVCSRLLFFLLSMYLLLLNVVCFLSLCVVCFEMGVWGVVTFV